MRTQKATTFLFALVLISVSGCISESSKEEVREKISINDGWKFMKYRSYDEADNLIYDIRPTIESTDDTKEADSRPTEAVELSFSEEVLKAYILPAANPFIKDSSKHYRRPDGNPGSDFPFVKPDFDDSAWENINLPHDWAIKGPFLEGPDAEVGGGMGRLPSHGVAWYRKKLTISEKDMDRAIYLDVDGAMSYAMVWFNGHLIGGWPYGYNSWRIDLTPYINFNGENQLAIRIDNPNHSSRWYPGGGIYRNVWLTKTGKIHIAHWGTTITTPEVSDSEATVELKAIIENTSDTEKEIEILTEIFLLDEEGEKSRDIVAAIPEVRIRSTPGSSQTIKGNTTIESPLLWGPRPTQGPNLYCAVSSLYSEGKLLDRYETIFGVRSIAFDPQKGMIVNGEQIEIKGVNQHHDLGALGAAFNTRAAERQLEVLQELGCNAIRMAHNPPAPELLDLTDRMGFLVIDEIFDSWERKKTPHDFHLIFPEWHEADIRAFIRRDKNHPSVILWSYGNEVGEQYTDKDGAELSGALGDIVKDEDPTRLTTASMNYAKPHMPFPASMDVLSLNYQGEGIRNAGAYAHLQGIKTPPLYPAFHEKFPGKVIISSETAAALSSRGTYLFPVSDDISSPIADGIGGDPVKAFVSSYELYTANFGSSADKVFASQDKHPFVAGEFVWSGWDYLGEPTPYYSARSSYFGVIDLAGFKKDRFYLYQSRWRPEHPLVHILPHWNWPERIGLVTPVHIFTSGDEVELFLNGRSLGKKKKAEYEYRLRWDDIIYEPGTLKAVAYKDGKRWIEDSIMTTGEPAKLAIVADRNHIEADGSDLSFIQIQVLDKNGLPVPDAANMLTFSLEGPGELIATDNGDPTDMTPFGSRKRKVFNGLALGIVRSQKNTTGRIHIIVQSPGLEDASIEILSGE